MFSTSKNIKEANDTIAQLQGELASVSKTIEDLKKSQPNLEAVNQQHADKIETLTKEHADKIEALTKEHNAKIADLEKSKEETKASVQKEVASKVTAMGIPEAEAFKAPTQTQTTSYETVMAKLQSMPRGSQERADFYNVNKGVLTQPRNSEATTTKE